MEKRKKSEKQEKINLFYRIGMFFLIGCFLGCVFETILCYFQRGYFESRKGLIYGPFNPVYGFGIAIIVFVLEKYKKNISIFMAGALLGGGIEYFCSWIQETMFGTISWDYSKYFLNFDGRTSLYHMIWWGILSLLFMNYLYPHIVNVMYKIKESKRFWIAVIITIFFGIDMFISGYANIRQKERLDGIKATTFIQKFFDKHYPNDLINAVYPNRRDARTKQKINQKK